MTFVGEGKVGRLLVGLKFVKELPCVVAASIKVVFANNMLDFLIFAGSSCLALIINLHTDRFERCIVALQSLRRWLVAPEGSFHISSHGFGYAVLDVRRKQVRIDILELSDLSVLVDNRAVPSDMADVLSNLATVGALALR